MKVAVIGIGNTAVADDGVGILTVRALGQTVSDERLSLLESERGGLDLLDLVTGFDMAIVVDAAKTGLHPPGTLVNFTLTDYSAPHANFSLHTMNLHDALALGSAVGITLPSIVALLGVEVTDTETFGAPCTPAVLAAIPQAVGLLTRMLQALLPDLRVASPARETVVP